VSKRVRLMGRSFVVYYGKGPVAGLENFDIAILEPQGWTTPHLRSLQAERVSTLAYVSVLEVPHWRFAEAGLRDEDFVVIEGRPWIKEPFDNRLARPDSQNWRHYLEGHVNGLYRSGWDGLFLDTLGDVEDEYLLANAGWLVPATADLVRFIARNFPERPIIVNNGLWRVVPLIADYIHGVCWEGELTPDILKQPWAQAMIDFLGKTAQQRQWVNMMLTHIAGTSLSAAQRLLRFSEDADRYGFLSYAAPGNYADIIRLRDGRVIGPARD
jgi:hypothetical protein